LMQPQPLTKLLAECNPDSSLLFVSDAGAARGHRRLARIRATAECLARLKRVSSFIAWLNPMPAPRWDGTSAQFIAGLVPMFQMDPDGFSNAVDCLRGQLAQR
ncbi:MAG: VWA containing CoxE family protein, partial [Candidatus Competibacteraceae bacterium]|nr:VWA containing CoxE family protein [Candidatus Competibacteraceae bacterium]